MPHTLILNSFGYLSAAVERRAWSAGDIHFIKRSWHLGHDWTTDIILYYTCISLVEPLGSIHVLHTNYMYIAFNGLWIFHLQYHRGRFFPQRWVFGITATEFDPPRTVFYLVYRRDRATLERLIRKHCRPGSVIMSDEWQGYRYLGQIGYQHHTVNHTTHFVHPVSGK